jgi:hypothetical protein
MIDDLARQLAQPMPRRRALRIMAGVLAATAIPGARPATAAVVSCGALGCSGKCCSATDWSIPSKQGVCCDDDAVCCSGGRKANDPDHTYGWCCSQGETCGEEIGDCIATCKSPNFECGTACCGPDQSCCPVTSEDDPMCCPDGEHCAKQLQQGDAGIRPDARYVCCPEERLVTAYTNNTACCPPGSVHQPGGGISTGGGACCTEGNICGDQCCDSLPRFPQRCVRPGYCEFEALLVDEAKVTAQRDGSVKVPITLKAATSAKVTIVLPAGARSSATGLTATSSANKPRRLGTATLRRGRRGRRTVRVRLNREGRRLLRRRRRLDVQVVLTVSDRGQKASARTPVTLRRP